jgi:hypothetical protein
MFTITSFSRIAGTLCLTLAGVVAAILPASAEGIEAAACDDAWHATAEQRAALGLELEQAYGARNRVLLWRLLMQSQGEPERIDRSDDYHYAYGPFLPRNFPDDPDVQRILGLINEEHLDDAILAIEALTRIPDPANTDIATERLLVRNELLFAGVLWTTGWGSFTETHEAGSRALKWMAVMDAHFLTLPLSILNHDIVVNGAYWRAVEDLDWFVGGSTRLALRGQQSDDWWLPNTEASLGVVAGVAEATRESPLLDWLQAMEATSGLPDGPWIGYLTERVAKPAYVNAYGHLMTLREQSSALPWQIAVARRWAPVFKWHDELGPGAYADHQHFAELERRAQSCELSLAEQYALGPLRFHDARIRTIEEQYPEGSTIHWNAEIDPTEATANDRTRQEIARFAMTLGQPKIAQQFQAARDPKAAMDSYLGPSLQALTAPDLDSFAAANPDPSAINLLPLRLLAELIEKPGLRTDLRAAVARMAWTRAYLLDDTAILRRITPLVGQTNEAMKPLLDVYQAAWTSSGQRQAGLALLLKTPGMMLVLPDGSDLYWEVPRVRVWSTKEEDLEDAVFKHDHLNPNDNNWWCRLDIGRRLSKMRSNFYDSPLGLDAAPARLRARLEEYRDEVLREHPILGQIDFEELGRLAKIPNAPVYLSQAAVERARSSWWWDRYFNGEEMADALALSIQVTRWGCHSDGPNGSLSNAAYRALHEIFPDSEAAKNTLYWYN